MLTITADTAPAWPPFTSHTQTARDRMHKFALTSSERLLTYGVSYGN